MDIATLGSAISSVVAFGKNIQTLHGFLGKLRANPDKAAVHLQAALAEIAKSCHSLDDAIATFVGLAKDPDPVALVRIQSGAFARDVAERGGHCRILKNIYTQHLGGWLRQALSNNTEYDLVRNIFEVFERGDTDLFYWLARIADDLQREAIALLPAVLANDTARVRIEVWRVFNELAPLQREMNRLMGSLFQTKADFLLITDAVPAAQ